MTDSGEELQAAARALFQRVAAQTAPRSLCHPVARCAAGWAGKLGEPMRVAVAGEIKHGKSTLVNALVAADAALPASDEAQDRAVATGQLETTYVLTELTYGSPPGIEVQYRDQDRPSVRAPLADLHRYTARGDQSGDAGLAVIDRVIVSLDAPMLRMFRLIDTPGFNSVYGTDAAAALALLNSTSGELDSADAVVFTIGNDGLSSLSWDVVRQFTVMTPLKAIGVIPRANQLWAATRAKTRPGDTQVMDLPGMAQPVIDAIRRGHGRELFHAIVPVAGILGEAAALAPDDDLTALRELIPLLDPDVLAPALTTGVASRMLATRPDFPLSPRTRARLVRTFSPWGLFTAVRAARDCPSNPDLRRALDEQSGVAGLRDLVRNHFGGRAGMVRVREALQDLTRLNRRLRLRQPEGSEDHAILERVGADLEAFQLAHEVTFSQADILGALYRGELTLSPGQTADLLRLTGERGGDLAARLGLPAGSSKADLRAAAMAASHRWAVASQMGRNQPAVQAMTRLCDAILGLVRSSANAG